MIKKVLFFIFLFATGFIAVAQKPRLYIGEINETTILSDTIIENGDKIPFAFLYNPEIYEQLLKKIPADKIDYIIKYSQRENYPAGLRSLSYWEYKTLKPAFFYFVAEVDLNGKLLTLIEMPAAENKNMPEALRPKTDIYFLARWPWVNPNFDIGGKKQYSKKIQSENEKCANEYTAFVKHLGDGMIDASLYFKTIVPVPALTKEAYVKRYKAALAVVAENEKAEAEDYAARKKLKEADKQRRIDSLKIQKGIVLKKITELSKGMIEDFDAGNFSAVFTRFRYWKIPIISKDIEIETPGVLNKERRHYTVTSRIEFVGKPGGIDLIDETKFSASMQTNIGYETHTESFYHGENFLQDKSDRRQFNNNKGSHYYEDGVVGSNQFYQAPWNYFQEYVLAYYNIPVVPSFRIVLTEVDAEAHVYTIGIKMKMPDRDAYVVYSPEDVYTELDKVANYNLRIKNIEEE